MARVKSSPNYCLRFVIRNKSCSDHELEVSYTDEDDDADVIDENDDDNNTYNCNTQKNVNQGIDNGGVGNNDNIDDDDDNIDDDDDDVKDDEDASSRNIFLKGCRSKSRKKKTFSFASK